MARAMAMVSAVAHAGGHRRWFFAGHFGHDIPGQVCNIRAASGTLMATADQGGPTRQPEVPQALAACATIVFYARLTISRFGIQASRRCVMTE